MPFLFFIHFFFCFMAALLVRPAAPTLNELAISNDLLQKMVPFPTVPTHLSRSHRVGAQRFQQFGSRCWHLESCGQCVCCGSCTKDDFLCESPPGSLDYCLLYEKVSLHTNLETRNESMTHLLPTDFPEI